MFTTFFFLLRGSKKKKTELLNEDVNCNTYYGTHSMCFLKLFFFFTLSLGEDNFSVFQRNWEICNLPGTWNKKINPSWNNYSRKKGETDMRQFRCLNSSREEKKFSSLKSILDIFHIIQTGTEAVHCPALGLKVQKFTTSPFTKLSVWIFGLQSYYR